MLKEWGSALGREKHVNLAVVFTKEMERIIGGENNNGPYMKRPARWLRPLKKKNRGGRQVKGGVGGGARELYPHPNRGVERE